MKIKKSVILFIMIITIIITGVLFTDKNLIEDSKNYLKGILETSKPQDLSIFVLPAIPIITIISPENMTYSTNTILLNYSIKNTPDYIWYNLDNTFNITIISPIYFVTTQGTHTFYLYANNTYGTAIKSISFFIDLNVEPTQPSSGGGGGGGGSIGNKTEQQKENITEPKEPFLNVTEQETPKNMTPPSEIPRTTKEIIINFLISLLFLILLIALVIILSVIIKRKKDRKNRKKKK